MPDTLAMRSAIVTDIAHAERMLFDRDQCDSGEYDDAPDRALCELVENLCDTLRAAKSALDESVAARDAVARSFEIGAKLDEATQERDEVMADFQETAMLLRQAEQQRDEARDLCRSLLACARGGDALPDLPGWVEERNPVLDWPISTMGEGQGSVWTRARNCLKNLGCDTVADVVRHTETQLLKQRNMGRLSVTAIRGWLAEHGLALREIPGR